MAIRNDITVDWAVSPRIITVASPSTEVTIQDLHDTCRDLEDDLYTGQQYPHLIDSAGKEDLGGGTLVGVTSTLQNAKLAFEARPGPTFVQCNISGGNLVAVDGAGAIIDPIQTTDFVQVIKTSSSSATLTEQSDIQYSSFNQGVTINATSGTTGTTFPTGTPRQPVDNLTDAKTIATARGFKNLYIKGAFTFGASDNIDGLTIIADSYAGTITVTSGCSTDQTEFKSVTITGTLSGTSITLDRCHVETLSGFEGFVHDSLLFGTITLSASNSAQFINCRDALPGSGTPTIDMNGSGSTLGVWDYFGGLQINNKTGTESVSVNAAAIRLVLDSTVTNGTILLKGTGLLINNSSATVDSDGFVNKIIVSDVVWDTVLADHLTAGTTGKALDDAGAAGNPWSTTVSGNTDPGTFGELVGKKLLTIAKFLGLK